MNRNRASVLGFVVIVGSIIALGARRALIATHPVGIGVQVAAVLLMIWARISFGMRSFHASANPTKGGLVTHGPYAMVRHPIYAAIFYFVATAVVSYFNWINLAIAVIGLTGLGVRIWAEESLIVATYPEYREYAARVKRLVPYVF